MYVLKYISKPPREPFSFLSAHFFSARDTPELTVHWSEPFDRGVCPLITLRGLMGENKENQRKSVPISLHCDAELTPLPLPVSADDVNR